MISACGAVYCFASKIDKVELAGFGKMESCAMPSPFPHPRDPLHGITLEKIVNELVARFGWVAMGDRIPIRCFQMNPSVKSSLTFLRKTEWARKKVEAWFIETQADTQDS